ncbi:unnamed protein product, partial [marine sediment metagenome]
MILDQIQDQHDYIVYVNKDTPWMQTIVNNNAPLVMISILVRRKGNPSNYLGIEISDDTT